MTALCPGAVLQRASAEHQIEQFCFQDCRCRRRCNCRCNQHCMYLQGRTVPSRSTAGGQLGLHGQEGALGGCILLVQLRSGALYVAAHLLHSSRLSCSGLLDRPCAFLS